MAYSLVAHVEAGLGSTGGTSSSIDTTGASFLVLSVSYFTGGVAPAITDSKGNTWVALTLRTTTSTAHRLYYCVTPTVGSGHTFSAIPPENLSYCSICVLAFSGSHASPYEAENGATGTATSLATGSVTPAENNELVIAGLSHENNTAGAVSINGGFTDYKVAHSSGNHQGCGIGYLIQTTAAAANPTWSITNSAELSASIACFKAAGGGGGSAVPVFLHHLMNQG